MARRRLRPGRPVFFLRVKSLMPDSQQLLGTLFVEAFRTLAPKRAVPEADVRYYPYAGLNHTIRLRSGRVYVRLSDIFRGAPINVHRALRLYPRRETPAATHAALLREGLSRVRM